MTWFPRPAAATPHQALPPLPGWVGPATGVSVDDLAPPARPPTSAARWSPGRYTVRGPSGAERLPAPGSIAETQLLSLQLRDALRGLLENPSDSSRAAAWEALRRHRLVTTRCPGGFGDG